MQIAKNWKNLALFIPLETWWGEITKCCKTKFRFCMGFTQTFLQTYNWNLFHWQLKDNFQPLQKYSKASIEMYSLHWKADSAKRAKNEQIPGYSRYSSFKIFSPEILVAFLPKMLQPAPWYNSKVFEKTDYHCVHSSLRKPGCLELPKITKIEDFSFFKKPYLLFSKTRTRFPISIAFSTFFYIFEKFPKIQLSFHPWVWEFRERKCKKESKRNVIFVQTQTLFCTEVQSGLVPSTSQSASINFWKGCQSHSLDFVSSLWNLKRRRSQEVDIILIILDVQI